MRFTEAYDGYQSQRFRQSEAARLLGGCDRSFRRYMQRYEDDGLEGLLDQRLQQPSHRCAPIDEVMALQDLYSSRYQGWNVRHFHCWYRREHQGHRSYSSGDDGHNQPPGYMNPFPADLPAPPEIVNPSWGSRGLPEGISTVDVKKRVSIDRLANRRPVSKQHQNRNQLPVVATKVYLSVATMPSAAVTQVTKVGLHAATPGRLSVSRLPLRK